VLRARDEIDNDEEDVDDDIGKEIPVKTLQFLDPLSCHFVSFFLVHCALLFIITGLP
jgi:hypothetical protein